MLQHVGLPAYLFSACLYCLQGSTMCGEGTMLLCTCQAVNYYALRPLYYICVISVCPF